MQYPYLESVFFINLCLWGGAGNNDLSQASERPNINSASQYSSNYAVSARRAAAERLLDPTPSERQKPTKK